jgi:flagellar biosynthesis activator protein FlaF
MGISAYKKTIRESENPRDIERRVLSRITGDIERHADIYDAAETREECLSILSKGLSASLQENLRFWSILKFDLIGDGNGLPETLRASIISIAFWMERQTADVMRGDPGVASIVEINNSILAGLSGMAPADMEA